MSEKGICKLTGAAVQARDWANELVRRESRGPGDMENAMRRLEARHGIGWRTFWELRYRTPADVLVGVYLKIAAAYQSECERQERLLRHEILLTKAKVGPFSPGVRAAETLVDEVK